MIPDILNLLNRDLATLEREIAAYPDDASLWKPVPGQPTSGGNLTLHLIGNLRHFIGAALGDTGFIRDRPAEFSTRGISRDALLAQVHIVPQEIEATLTRMNPDRLSEPFPIEITGLRPTIGAVLLHLCTHLTFHLGQMDYHRRAVTGDKSSVGPLSLDALMNRR